MTGRERVLRALEFRNPDRVPRDLWALPAVPLQQGAALEKMKADFPMDIGQPYACPGLTSSGQTYERVGEYTDEWGSVWSIAEVGVVGEVVRPALAEWSDLASFQPPWRLLDDRDLGYISRQCAASDQFMLSACTARPFERMQFLRGTANLFMDLAYDCDEVYRLREMVHDFYLKDIELWCKSDVDGVFFMDDWGTQQSLLISPKQWRAFYKPLYRDYVDLIHAAGKKAFFHSDGHIAAIYPDLIEIGVDAVNSQLFCMDIEDLAAKYKGKITFWGEIDRQNLLPFGTPEAVRAGVRRVRNALDDGSGGVIAQCEWGKDNPVANVHAVYDAWQAPLETLSQ